MKFPKIPFDRKDIFESDLNFSCSIDEHIEKPIILVGTNRYLIIDSIKNLNDTIDLVTHMLVAMRPDRTKIRLFEDGIKEEVKNEIKKLMKNIRRK